MRIVYDSQQVHILFSQRNQELCRSVEIYPKYFFFLFQIQDIFVNIGVQMTIEDFDNLYKIAASRHPNGEVSVESFRSVLDDAQTQSYVKSQGPC